MQMNAIKKYVSVCVCSHFIVLKKGKEKTKKTWGACTDQIKRGLCNSKQRELPHTYTHDTLREEEWKKEVKRGKKWSGDGGTWSVVSREQQHSRVWSLRHHNAWITRAGNHTQNRARQQHTYTHTQRDISPLPNLLLFLLHSRNFYTLLYCSLARPLFY